VISRKRKRSGPEDRITSALCVKCLSVRMILTRCIGVKIYATTVCFPDLNPSLRHPERNSRRWVGVDHSRSGSRGIRRCQNPSATIPADKTHNAPCQVIASALRGIVSKVHGSAFLPQARQEDRACTFVVVPSSHWCRLCIASRPPCLPR
jgi:hypothetical protein